MLIKGYKATITVDCVSGSEVASVTLNLGGPMGKGETKAQFSERVARDLRKLLAIWTDADPVAQEHAYQVEKKKPKAEPKPVTKLEPKSKAKPNPFTRPKLK